jgi:glycerol-3-phosphate O-acyltransferase/dihydroxyacetone phosphate acyltransferase
MLYHLLRSISGIALRWFYSRIDVEGLERIPATRPLLLAVNHPNALVDAMVVTWMFPRRVVLTAKATLFRNPIARAFFNSAGVVPLIRAQDVRNLGPSTEAGRNKRAFDALNDALARGRAVLIFPEGITGDHPSLAPFKTGAARMALQARDSNVHGLSIVPIGLTFERKDAPRTRVFVHVGDPIDVESWPRVDQGRDVGMLTGEIERRLHALTLNFETSDNAARATALASLFARLFVGAQAVPPVWTQNAPLAEQVAMTRRIESARAQLITAPAAIRERVDALLHRLARFESNLARYGLAFEDLEIALDLASGSRFVLRETPIVLIGGPFALWGWLNHVLPFNLARLIGSTSVQSATDPAMRTIVSGIVLVLLFYIAQGALVYALLGWWVAAAYLVSLPIAADVNFYFRARLSRVMRRARAYLLFRRHSQLRKEFIAELQWLRDEARAIEALLDKTAEANGDASAPKSAELAR